MEKYGSCILFEKMIRPFATFLIHSLIASFIVVAIITCIVFIMPWTYHDAVVRQVYMFPEEQVRKYNNGHYPPKREYLEVTFDDDSIKNSIRHEFAAMYMNQIIQAHDTVHGIHYIFGPKAKFGDLARVLDVLYYNRACCWIPEPAELWFLNKPD